MSSDPSQDHDKFEKTELQKLEALHRDLASRIRAFLEATAKSFLPPSDISQFVEHLHEWKKVFQGYEAGAAFLRNVGRPRLSEYLCSLRSALDQSVSEFEQKHRRSAELADIFAKVGQDVAIGQRRRAGIAEEGREAWRKALAEGVERREKVDDDHTEKWHRVFRVDCPHCGHHLGTYLITHCPKCRQRIIAP